MTHEKYRAICRAGFLLERLLYHPKLDRESREEAHRVLRHFPGAVELEKIFHGKEKYGLPVDYWKSMSNEPKFYRKEAKYANGTPGKNRGTAKIKSDGF